MVGISDVIETVTKPIQAVADLARRALSKNEPKPVQRKSKGWRRHVRKMKAKQHGV